MPITIPLKDGLIVPHTSESNVILISTHRSVCDTGSIVIGCLRVLAETITHTATRFQRRSASMLTVLMIGLVIALSGCGSTSAPSPTPPPAPTPTLSVSGDSQVRVGATATFVPQSSGLTNASLTWSVNGISSGNSSVGTITSAGVYTPPASVPSTNTVTISCSTSGTPALSASATLAILNPVAAIQSSAAVDDGNFDFVIDVVGTGFLSQSSVSFDGTVFPATLVSSSHLQVTISQAALPATTTAVVVTNPDPGNSTSNTSELSLPQPKTSIMAASRLLDQTTFGTTAADIHHVQQVGLSGYIDEQLSTSATLLPQLTSGSLPSYCGSDTRGCARFAFWQTALTAPDQLRQRVAFALSQIWVVSDIVLDGTYYSYYSNLLANDAFGNWRQVMKDVTLSPAMGVYLNLANSKKPATGQHANENYGREFLQLMSVGVNQLNMDGTLVVDSQGQPIPTYSATEIQGFARVFTGWTFSNSDGTAPSKFAGSAVVNYPLQAMAAFHDTTQKAVLRSGVISAGGTAEQDLDAAIDNVFNDPSLPPFISRQLILKLVKSNPSPQYIARVASVFTDNGSGVRGDLASVVRAIVLDPEAREGDSQGSTALDAGHLREPILWLTSIVKGLEAAPSSNKAFNTLNSWAQILAELPNHSPSVFNFYPPDHVLPDTAINAPEFAIESTATIMQRTNAVNAIVLSKVDNPVIDLSHTSLLAQLAATSPDALLNRLDIVFMNGKMSTQMRAAIKGAMAGTKLPEQAARIAVYLVVSSPQYMVEQ